MASRRMELCHPLAVILSLPVSTHAPSTRVEEMWFASRAKGGLEWEASAAQMRGQHKTAMVFGSPEASFGSPRCKLLFSSGESFNFFALG